MTFKGMSDYARFLVHQHDHYMRKINVMFMENYAKPGHRVWNFNKMHPTYPSLYSFTGSQGVRFTAASSRVLPPAGFYDIIYGIGRE